MNIEQFKLKVSTQNIFERISLLIFISSLIMLSCSDSKVSEEQSNYLTPEVLCGTVQFTDGCSPQLDSLISFGFALIHHMTYDDAEYTFNKVIELDPDCFWGHWGKAMTYIHPLWPDVPSEERMDRGWFLSQTALGLAKTDKEKLYGAAVASYYDSGLDQSEWERLAEYKNGWQQAHNQLPEDLEAQLFYVLTMLATVSPDDKSYDIQREAGAIAEQSLEVIPDHPGGFHYAIHAYDYPPLAPSALRVARRYNEIAPEIPHALHMPTHIYTRLGKWQESIDLNLRSAAAAWRLPVNGQISGQYFHALDYLAYAYLQQSEYEKVENMIASIDTLSTAFQPATATVYALAAIKARVAMEYQQWTDAADLVLEYESKLPWEKFPQYEALVYFAKGIGGGRSGNSEIAKLSYKKLEALQNALGDSRSSQYWIDQIEVQKTVVKAWQMYAEEDMEKAMEIMLFAAELEDATEKNPVTPGELLPVREMLGDLLLEMNQPDEALLQYEQSLTTSPNRFNSLYGAGKSAKLIGDKDKARYYFTTLIEISVGSDLGRERLQYASNFINEL